MTAPSLFLTVDPSTSYLGTVRARTQSWLDTIGVVDDRWELVVTELLTNAVEASTSDHPVSVSFELHGPAIHLSVSNRGTTSTNWSDPQDVPGPDVARGRGLHLVRALTSQLRVESLNDRTVVACSHIAPIDSTPRNAAIPPVSSPSVSAAR